MGALGRHGLACVVERKGFGSGPMGVLWRFFREEERFTGLGWRLKVADGREGSGMVSGVE